MCIRDSARCVCISDQVYLFGGKLGKRRGVCGGCDVGEVKG